MCRERKARVRRQVAAYTGLAPMPWQSRSVDQEQGVSKAGNPNCEDADPDVLALAAAVTELRAGPMV